LRSLPYGALRCADGRGRLVAKIACHQPFNARLLAPVPLHDAPKPQGPAPVYSVPGAALYAGSDKLCDVSIPFDRCRCGTIEPVAVVSPALVNPETARSRENATWTPAHSS
jgi:hypothetical protein